LTLNVVKSLICLVQSRQIYNKNKALGLVRKTRGKQYNTDALVPLGHNACIQCVTHIRINGKCDVIHYSKLLGYGVQLPDSLDKSCPWNPGCHSACQEILSFLWNPNILHKSMPPDPVLRIELLSYSAHSRSILLNLAIYAEVS
jgi:hypothetical protein